MICFVANRGSCIRRDGDIDNDLAKEFAISIEYLNAMISAVRYINIVLGINRNAMRCGELTWLVSRFTPRLQPIAIFIDLGNSRIDVTVADISIAGGIPCHIRHLSE